MIKYLLVAIFSYLFGVLSVIVFSVIKVSSKCSEKEKQDNNFIDYGNIVYEEIERRENEGK